jgi:DNA-binding NtrC family response regulator
MRSEKLLWISSQAQLADGGWCELLNEFCLIPVSTFADARDITANQHVGCVLVTGDVPDLDRFEALEVLRLHDANLPVIFWDPNLRAAEAVRLIRAGANHCFGSGDCLNALKEHLESTVLDRSRQTKNRERASDSQEPWRAFLVGESRAMKTVAETIRLIGPRRCTVLISGETGTGKEMAARALHMASPRANQPMVAINCSALPENLLEAELFGHVKGAFTGAINTRVGRFEQANKSTLFLDEIGDMPIELQAKLLRVLQDREVQRLGSSESVKVDVRVIAASNLNLLERVRQGKFREDLYYRLNVVPLEMPALRQRAGDIALLVPHFVKKVCALEGIPVRRISPETLTRLESRQWPGNVRELENAIEMVVAMSGDREELYPSDFGLSNPAPKVVSMPCASATALEFPTSMDFGTAVSQFEQKMLEQALQKTAGNKTAAAELLGMKRTTLIMKLRSLDNLRTACVG